jgi:hypothetical protein
MTEVVLEPASIHPFVRQGVPAGVSQHMNVGREGQPSHFARALDHPCNPLPLERITAFVDED